MTFEEYNDDELYYESLLDGVDYIEDEQWAEILYDTAYGRLPRGFTIRKDGISYNAGGQRQVIMPPLDPEEAIEVVMDFFRTVGGIKTDDDVEIEQKSLIEARDKQNEEYTSLSWSKLKTGAKRNAVVRFANRIIDEYKVSKSLLPQLETLINVAINSGAIRSNDIAFAQGEIISINPLSFDGYKFRLSDEAQSRIKLPLIKGVCPDNVYFNPYNNYSHSSIKNFSGFANEWQKFNQEVRKNFNTNRTTRTTRHSESMLSPNSPNAISSIRRSGWDDSIDPNIIFRPTNFDVNPDNPLLNPRNPSYNEQLAMNSKFNSNRTSRSTRRSHGPILRSSIPS